MCRRPPATHRAVGSEEAGSATVWVLACLLLLGAAACAVATVAAVAAVRHGVSDAADEAALAAAAALPAPAPLACGRASRVAAAGHGQLDSCTVEPSGCVVRVVVSRAAPGLLALLGRVRAAARAGSPCRGPWLNRAARTGDVTTERTAVDLSLQTRPEGDKTVVSVAGEIDVYTAPKLREQIVQLVEDGRYHLVVDMEEVEFLDSTGLGVLVGGLKRVRAHDGSLHLVCTQERILKIFRITGLTKVFPVHATVADAVAAQD